jgi:plastocyanin
MSHATRRRTIAVLAGLTASTVLAGCSGGGEQTEPTDESGTPEQTPTSTPTETATPTPASETVLVGPDARNVFEPDSLEIAVGTQVTFRWESSGHSLIVDSQPDAVDWGGVEETKDEGYEHTHTFAEPGTYEYHCGPHEAFGMTGSITVTE